MQRNFKKQLENGDACSETWAEGNATNDTTRFKVALCEGVNAHFGIALVSDLFIRPSVYYYRTTHCIILLSNVTQ